MIHVGIDIGHGETSVSRTPGYNDEKTSRIALNRGSHDKDMKVVSALCRNNKNDKWRFVLNDLDYQSSEIREGFKGRIDKIDNKEREALGEFVKLVFEIILENDGDLNYNRNTGEANFDICIACPSDWRRQNSNIPDKYLRYFRDECGIKPIRMCINESDAAFYTKYDKYEANNTVLVIDLGSSTIDFTTYSGAKCLKELCWGVNLGAHIIEDKLIEKGYEDEENENGMRMVEAERKKNGQGSAEKALSLVVRKDKEEYFTTQQYKSKLPFVTEVPIRTFVHGWTGGLRAKAFTIELKFDEFEKVISDYKNQLKTIMEFAAKKISGHGVTPTHILLSGGASRMDFVLDCAQKTFPKAKITLDNTPEWVVSDGASKYIKTWSETQGEIDKLKYQFRQWAQKNLIPTVKKETLVAFEEALRKELKWRLNKYYVENTDKGTNLYAFKRIAVEAIENSTKTPEFKANADKRFIKSINDLIVDKMQKIIYDAFKKPVTINRVFVDPGDFFSDFTAEHDAINVKIEKMVHELFDNWFEDFFGGDVNWEKTRYSNERSQLVNKACEDIPKGYIITFDESIIESWIEEACDSIQSILIENGLFEITI